MNMAKNATPRSERSVKNALSSSTPVARESGASSAPGPEDDVTEENLVRMTLDEAIRRYDAGEVYINPDAPEGPDLPDSFWENAVWEGPHRTRPVHLKLDADVFEHFRQLAHDRMTILISHRFSTVRMADQIAVLDEGAVVEYGTHAELLDMNGRYATLFNLQARGYR